jgi:hypothetical protein
MTKDDLMSDFYSVVTDRRLTLDAVEEHVENVDADEYLFDRFRTVTSSGSSGRRGVFVYDWDEWTTLALMQSRSRLGTADNEPRPRGAATVPVSLPASAPICRGSCAPSWPSPATKSVISR